MASQRGAYQKYIKCIDNLNSYEYFTISSDAAALTKKSFIQKIPILKWFLRKTPAVNEIIIRKRKNLEQCLALKEKACQLCLCCRGCPCKVTSPYVIFVALLVGAGVLVLLAFARFDVLYNHAEKMFPSATTTPTASSASSPSSSFPSSSSMRSSSSSSNSKKKKVKSPLHTFTKKERDIVKKAIHLWQKHKFLPNTALRNKLLKSTNIHKNEESNTRSSLISTVLIILALIIALVESSLSETLIHSIFSFFSFIVGPLLSKAIAMLSLTVFFTMIDYEDDKNNNDFNNVNATERRKNNNPWYEYPRIFSFYAFLGATILSAVDTGTHDFETSAGDEGGSRIWYTSLGLVGTFSVLCLEYGAPAHFVCDYNWPVFVSMSILAFSHERRIMLVLSSLALVAYGIWLEEKDDQENDGNEERTTTVATGTVGETRATNSLEESAKAPSEETGIADFNNNLHNHRQRQQHENIGSLFLLVAALISEIDQKNQNGGAILAMMSIAVIKYGMQRETSSFQGTIGAAGMCIATYLNFIKDPSLSGLVNMPISLLVAFIPSTILLGGWNEVVMPSIVFIPKKTRSGMHDALVGITLALLLLLCIVGNSHSLSDWKFMMDFVKSDNDNSYFKLVDGEYSYHNRGIYILPWCLPLFLYYRILYKFWPEQEMKCRRYCILQIGVTVVVVSHLMRLASWSELFLIVAWLISAWPKLEELLRGGK